VKIDRSCPAFAAKYLPEVPDWILPGKTTDDFRDTVTVAFDLTAI
jgi:hypothetical protein